MDCEILAYYVIARAVRDGQQLPGAPTVLRCRGFVLGQRVAQESGRAGFAQDDTEAGRRVAVQIPIGFRVVIVGDAEAANGAVRLAQQSAYGRRYYGV